MLFIVFLWLAYNNYELGGVVSLFAKLSVVRHCQMIVLRLKIPDQIARMLDMLYEKHWTVMIFDV